LKSQTYLIIQPFLFGTILVNADDNDIIVESSDLTLFKLHRDNLQAYAGAFPLPENVETSTPTSGGSSAIEKIRVNLKLPERACVLEIVFEYLYPKRYYPGPDLEDVEIVEFLAIADAAEKYQVFAAAPLCSVRLK